MTRVGGLSEDFRFVSREMEEAGVAVVPPPRPRQPLRP